jgi:hypothetical protein
VIDLPIHNFTLVQGDTFQFTAYITDSLNVPINITGWRVRMQIRMPAGCGSDKLIQELSTDNGAIILDGPNGRMDITMTEVQSTAVSPDVYEYDFETTDLGGVVTTRFAGNFTLLKQVTR